MVEPQIPVLAWAAFGVAWVAGLTLFGCLFVITRRLAVSWRKGIGGYSLDSRDAARIGKLLFGMEQPPAEARIGELLWAVRGCWLLMLVSIALFMIKLAGVA